MDLSQIRAGDRIAGAPFAGRSAVWGAHGAAATAHPMATLTAIDILRSGGSAVDAAIAANACLGFLEPTACGIGGDVFALMWDPSGKQVVGLNGSGRSPRALTLETHRARAVGGRVWRYGAVSVSTPGAVDGWAMLHACADFPGKFAAGVIFHPRCAPHSTHTLSLSLSNSL